MPRVFQRVASALFGLDQATIDALVARSAAMQAPRRAHPRRHLAARTPTEPVARSLWGDEEADGEDDVLVASPPEGSRLRKRQSTDTSGSRRIASSVRCRGKLHTDPTLAVLNTPVYIATDSRKPMSDPNLKLFFDTFPCSFVLSDFVKVTDVNRVPVAAFEKLAGLTSAEDGLKLDKFLYPLLEAVIAAKVRLLPLSKMTLDAEHGVTGFGSRRDARVDVQRVRRDVPPPGLRRRDRSAQSRRPRIEKCSPSTFAVSCMYPHCTRMMHGSRT